MIPEFFAARLQGPAGVYKVPPGAADALSRAAGQLGYLSVRIPLREVRTKGELLAKLAECLCFPDWFGHNWDALEDCLKDLSWLPARGYVLVLEDADVLANAAADEFAVAIEILQSAADWWQAEGVPFWALADAARAPLPDLP